MDDLPWLRDALLFWFGSNDNYPVCKQALSCLQTDIKVLSWRNRGVILLMRINSDK